LRNPPPPHHTTGKISQHIQFKTEKIAPRARTKCGRQCKTVLCYAMEKRARCEPWQKK